MAEARHYVPPSQLGQLFFALIPLLLLDIRMLQTLKKETLFRSTHDSEALKCYPFIVVIY